MSGNIFEDELFLIHLFRHEFQKHHSMIGLLVSNAPYQIAGDVTGERISISIYFRCLDRTEFVICAGLGVSFTPESVVHTGRSVSFTPTGVSRSRVRASF